MKDKIVHKRYIYYKMNHQTLKYNIMFPFFIFVFLCFCVTISIHILSNYIDKNITNSLKNRTFYVEIQNNDDKKVILELTSVISFKPALSTEEKEIYEVVMDDYLKVDETIYELFEKNNICAYHSLDNNVTQNSNINKEPIIIFFRLLKCFYIALIFVFLIIIFLLTIREFDTELVSREHLKLLAFEKSQVIYLHFFLMLKVIFYIIIEYLILGGILFITTHTIETLFFISIFTCLPFIIVYILEVSVFFKYKKE